MNRSRERVSSVAVKEEANKRIIAISAAATALAVLFTHRKIRANHGSRYGQLQEDADQAVEDLSEEERLQAMSLAKQIASRNVEGWGKE
jgi:hypothetical protein